MRDEEATGKGLSARSYASRGRRWSRPLVLGLACSFFLFCLGATAFVYLLRHPDLVQSEHKTFRVQSRSMEPTWRGPRFEATCPECGGIVATSLDIATASADVGPAGGNEASPEVQRFRNSARTLSCPNCGFADVDASGAVFRDGELLRVLPLDATKREPERWDAAIFCDQHGVYTLKRLVGLPGERVTICNGDVWIDGEPTRRTVAQIWRTAEELYPTEETRTRERLFVSRVVKLRKATAGGGERIEAVPSAVSNESQTPCFNGGSGPVELVRDFLTRFNWDATGVGGDSLTILVRRPERAWSLEYTASSGRVVLRSIPLTSGRTETGKSFEELDASDFARARAETFETEPAAEAPGTLSVEVMAVDGELVLSLSGAERARVALGDGVSDATAAISTPFVILGDVSRASSIRIYRDLHYSSADWRSSEPSDDSFYALGDNSPASHDSRFSDVGTIPAESVRYIVTPLEESR